MKSRKYIQNLIKRLVLRELFLPIHLTTEMVTLSAENAHSLCTRLVTKGSGMDAASSGL